MNAKEFLAINNEALMLSEKLEKFIRINNLGVVNARCLLIEGTFCILNIVTNERVRVYFHY